jgi:DNA-binding MarR family transcriptional regulator
MTSDGSYFPSGLHNALRLYARFSANVDRRLGDSGLPSTQRRIVLELLHRPNMVDAELALYLGLDRSFLSRTLKQLISDGLVGHKPGLRHRGQRHLFLTELGKQEAERLRNLLGEAIPAEFMAMTGEDQIALLASARVQGPRGSERPAEDPIGVRPSEPSDFPWFLSQMDQAFHGVRKMEFIGEVAEVIRKSIQERENSDMRWTAVQAGIPVGSCVLARLGHEVDWGLEALYVTHSARRLGAGKEMLRQALEAAKEAGYLNVYAVVPDPETELSHLLESAGFEKLRAKDRNRFWLGKVADFSAYQLAFPMPEL